MIPLCSWFENIVQSNNYDYHLQFIDSTVTRVYEPLTNSEPSQTIREPLQRVYDHYMLVVHSQLYAPITIA